MSRQMNFIMISPHFPTNYITFARRLHDIGFRTLGIASTPYDELSDELKSYLTEYYRVDDLEDYDQVYRAVAFFAHKYGRIDRIESHNEYWLELDAKLRTDFNVFGYKEKDMESIKTKSKMKEVFKQAGLKVARGRVFANNDDAIQLVKELGYPVVIKPNSGVGANDTYRITNEEQLLEFFNRKNPSVEYIMEEFIDGDIVTFDGLTDHEGNIVFYASLEFSEAVLSTVEKDNDMYCYLPRTISAELVELGKKCVKAFNIRERFFHFEFFRVKSSKELMALEINCRPPGGLTIDMWNYANDFDIFREYGNIVKDNLFEGEISKHYNVVYISRKANKNYKYSLEDIRSRFDDAIIRIESIPGVFAGIMGEIGVIARTETLYEMREIITYTQEKV